MDSKKFKIESGFDLFMLDGDLVVSGDCTKTEAETALKKHQDKLEADLIATENAKKALLEKLGITEDEAKLLLA